MQRARNNVVPRSGRSSVDVGLSTDPAGCCSCSTNWRNVSDSGDGSALGSVGEGEALMDAGMHKLCQSRSLTDFHLET